MYNVGDKIVHPMHGAGTIDSVIVQTVNGKELEYYILKLPTNNMTIMVPVAASEKIGIRDIITEKQADNLLASIKSIEIDENTNWNQRYRDNSARIKSGDLDEVIRVIKSLTYRDIKSGLSTGERKMLHSAKQILLSELVLSKGLTYKEIEAEVDNAILSATK